jgi:chaperone required for assembly of F1-ATPase
LQRLDAFALTAAHAMTTLLGSAVLSVAHAKGRLACADAWAAAHIDEDFQAEKWGLDSLAKARRDRQWWQMQAASRLFALSGEPEAG